MSLEKLHLYERWPTMRSDMDQENLNAEESERLCNILYELQEEVDQLLRLRDATGEISSIRDFKIQNGKWEYKWFTGRERLL